MVVWFVRGGFCLIVSCHRPGLLLGYVCYCYCYCSLVSLVGCLACLWLLVELCCLLTDCVFCDVGWLDLFVMIVWVFSCGFVIVLRCIVCVFIITVVCLDVCGFMVVILVFGDLGLRNSVGYVTLYNFSALVV